MLIVRVSKENLGIYTLLVLSYISGALSLVVLLINTKLSAYGLKMQLTPSVKSYVEEKLGKAVQKHSHLVREVDVRLSIRGGEIGKGAKERRCEVRLTSLLARCILAYTSLVC